MSEQPFKWLDWRNRFTRHLIQPLDGVDCFQENVLLNPENNLIVLNLSEGQFLKMFSALMTGAEISYPDESLQLVADFLKGIQCPPTLIPEECFTLPTYANNIAYTPVNPFIEPNVIPDGYLSQPFLVNGQNGNDFPTYEPFDVVIPFDAITFDLNFFEDIAGQLPTLEIMVQGTGSVNLKFLTSVQGGLVVVTLDNPPNLLDILAGIVTGSENIVDLNQDLVSLPPETAKELIYPVSVETGGIHTIYAVFLPILDDSLIPIRFGGGFRGLELCGFLPEGDMGLQNLRFLDCNLEQQNSDGSWSVVDGWEDWLDCVPSGGGGAGGANIRVTTFDPSLADATTTNTTFTTIDTLFNITPIYSKMLVIVNNLTLSHSTAGNRTEARIVRATTNIGTYAQVTSVLGTTGRQVTTSDLFEDIPIGVNTAYQLQIRGTAAGTASLNDATRVNVTVIEFENAEDLFVQDIRYVSATRQLEKKIGGAWITVTDSLAATLNAIEAIANNAASAAAAAQSTANNALTVANGAVTVNNTQNTRLTNLENDVEQIIDIDIPQINLTLADHEARITALEAVIGVDSPYFDGGVWSHTFDWTLGSNLGWSPTNMTYVNNFGWNFGLSGSDCSLELPSVTIKDSRITHVKVEFFRNSAGGENILFSFPLAVSGQQMFNTTGGGTVDARWYKVPNETVIYNPELHFDFVTAAYQLKRVLFLGRGENPFI